MGGVGSGSAKRRSIELICKWEECKLPFLAKRKDAMFCCQSCRDAFYAHRAMLESGELIKCRICGKNIVLNDIFLHFAEVHNIIAIKNYKRNESYKKIVNKTLIAINKNENKDKMKKFCDNSLILDERERKCQK